MKRESLLVPTSATVGMLALLAASADAAPVLSWHLPAAVDDAARPSPVVDRPEIRSFQAYSGLQFGFRPDPPIVRGVEKKRPSVVMPVPVAPLIEYGAPQPYSAQWYAYCAERFESFEPRTGLYTAFSGRKRLCR